MCGTFSNCTILWHHAISPPRRPLLYHGPFLRTGSPLHELLSAAVSAVAPISTMFVTAAPTRTEAERLREATVVRKSLRLAHLHTVSDPDRLCECASVPSTESLWSFCAWPVSQSLARHTSSQRIRPLRCGEFAGRDASPRPCHALH